MIVLLCRLAPPLPYCPYCTGWCTRMLPINSVPCVLDVHVRDYGIVRLVICGNVAPLVLYSPYCSLCVMCVIAGICAYLRALPVCRILRAVVVRLVFLARVARLVLLVRIPRRCLVWHLVIIIVAPVSVCTLSHYSSMWCRSCGIKLLGAVGFAFVCRVRRALRVLVRAVHGLLALRVLYVLCRARLALNAGLAPPARRLLVFVSGCCDSPYY